SLSDPHWLEGMRKLARYQWSWDLRVPFWHLEEAAGVLEKVPELEVVLNHTGLPWDRSEAGLAHWRKGMKALARLPQVYCKISELGLLNAAWTVASNQRVVQEAVELFGPSRCMFGSNFPVASLRVGFLSQVLGIDKMLQHLTAAERHDIFVNNAISFYRLEPFCRQVQKH
ncbi:MAG: amidohydrolase, partial [Betaproteobacteria bacterium]|nr:amidohydrolase [Betaproteobacteria bacterium]